MKRKRLLMAILTAVFALSVCGAASFGMAFAAAETEQENSFIRTEGVALQMNSETAFTEFDDPLGCFDNARAAMFHGTYSHAWSTFTKVTADQLAAAGINDLDKVYFSLYVYFDKPMQLNNLQIKLDVMEGAADNGKALNGVGRLLYSKNLTNNFGAVYQTLQAGWNRIDLKFTPKGLPGEELGGVNVLDGGKNIDSFDTIPLLARFMISSACTGGMKHTVAVADLRIMQYENEEFDVATYSNGFKYTPIGERIIDTSAEMEFGVNSHSADLSGEVEIAAEDDPEKLKTEDAINFKLAQPQESFSMPLRLSSASAISPFYKEHSYFTMWIYIDDVSALTELKFNAFPANDASGTGRAYDLTGLKDSMVSGWNYIGFAYSGGQGEDIDSIASVQFDGAYTSAKTFLICGIGFAELAETEGMYVSKTIPKENNRDYDPAFSLPIFDATSGWDNGKTTEDIPLVLGGTELSYAPMTHPLRDTAGYDYADAVALASNPQDLSTMVQEYLALSFWFHIDNPDAILYMEVQLSSRTTTDRQYNGDDIDWRISLDEIKQQDLIQPGWNNLVFKINEKNVNNVQIINQIRLVLAFQEGQSVDLQNVRYYDFSLIEVPLDAPVYQNYGSAPGYDSVENSVNVAPTTYLYVDQWTGYSEFELWSPNGSSQSVAGKGGNITLVSRAMEGNLPLYSLTSNYEFKKLQVWIYINNIDLLEKITIRINAGLQEDAENYYYWDLDPIIDVLSNGWNRVSLRFQGAEYGFPEKTEIGYYSFSFTGNSDDLKVNIFQTQFVDSPQTDDMKVLDKVFESYSTGSSDDMYLIGFEDGEEIVLPGEEGGCSSAVAGIGQCAGLAVLALLAASAGFCIVRRKRGKKL